jgi:hypothetical protein
VRRWNSSEEVECKVDCVPPGMLLGETGDMPIGLPTFSSQLKSARLLQDQG